MICTMQRAMKPTIGKAVPMMRAKSRAWGTCRLEDSRSCWQWKWRGSMARVRGEGRFWKVFIDFAKGFMPFPKRLATSTSSPLLWWRTEYQHIFTTCKFNLQHTPNQWWFIDNSGAIESRKNGQYDIAIAWWNRMNPSGVMFCTRVLAAGKRHRTYRENQRYIYAKPIWRPTGVPADIDFIKLTQGAGGHGRFDWHVLCSWVPMNTHPRTPKDELHVRTEIFC